MPDEYGDETDLFEIVDRTAASNPRPPTSADNARKVVQPTPQALPSRKSASSILVSPRQKGNPILNSIKSLPWEYSDIPADFVLGQTTCALFLSLKYHRLHPEYIYSRIRQLGQKYLLRLVMVMVDIENHQDPLKELSKTSLINNVTLILTWSANEAGRYLELFKSCENAAPTGIKAQKATTFADNLVDFITVPRSINKTDAIGIVSNFGSVRTSVNARPEDLSHIAGWGDKKVKAWCQSVREPFRVTKTKRRLGREDSRPTQSNIEQDSRVAARLGIGASLASVDIPAGPSTSIGTRPDVRLADDYEPGADEEEAMAEAFSLPPRPSAAPKPATPPVNKPQAEENLSEGMMAALARLRQT
ncbi:DNA repair protein rad10 [Aureobasidium sp. EXF-12298]|nr:DNA repair protein rad10 [Aureobasidium sp. EXF-12298]KAI4754471.1 DNA repair protein rad10 [Aureobasidium sp. EXF-12344]KAI4773133.1 DNA repair protein rad10 [Aureobasidium sp. EXF-3400]